MKRCVGLFVLMASVAVMSAKAESYSVGEPTNEETYMLETINRSRADANAEAQRMKNTTIAYITNTYNYFHVDLDVMVQQFATLDQTVQPVAMNAKLLAAARLHSQDMLDNVFQGHVSSSNPPAPNQPGDEVDKRIERQGYTWSTVGENVASSVEEYEYARYAFEVDWGGSEATSGMQVPPGHRECIHNKEYHEVGISVLQGSKTSGDETAGPWLVTEDFASSSESHAFICGVTYRDSNNNSFYDVGEGLGSVTVTVAGVTATGISSASGAYAVPISANGSYTVSFKRSDLPSYSTSATIADANNVKVDYVWDGTGPIPVIQTQPASATNNYGFDATISSSVASESQLYIQWTKDGSAITDATNQSITITSAKSTDTGEYAFTASNMYGKVTSETAKLTIIPYEKSQTFKLAKNASTNFSLVGYFDQAVEYASQEEVSHGEVTGNPPSLTYTPTTDFVGSDFFTYYSYSGSVTSSIATIRFIVGGKPALTPIIFLLFD